MNSISFLEELIEKKYYFIGYNRFSIDDSKLFFIKQALVGDEYNYSKAHKFLRDIITEIKYDYEEVGGNFSSFIDLVSMEEVEFFMHTSPSKEIFLNSILPSYDTSSENFEPPKETDYHSIIDYGVNILYIILKHL